jgi:hypothetical protein
VKQASLVAVCRLILSKLADNSSGFQLFSCNPFSPGNPGDIFKMSKTPPHINAFERP